MTVKFPEDLTESMDKIHYLYPFIVTYSGMLMAGGSLHVVLDDNNLDDDTIRWCLQHAYEMGDLFGAAIGEYLLLLTMEEREIVISVVESNT